MGISSDQRVSDTADSMQTDDIAAVGAEEVKESLSSEILKETREISYCSCVTIFH